MWASCYYCTGVSRVAATRIGRDMEDSEDREDNIAIGREGDRSKDGAAAGNTNEYDEISTIV